MKVFRRNSQERGSVMLMVIVISAIIVAGGYWAVDMLDSSKKFAGKKLLGLELELIANDIKEIGKYLIFYEKVFYTKNADNSPANPLILDSDIKDIWSKPLSVNANNPCGAYDEDLNYQGTSVVNGKKIFCAYVFRNNTVSNQLLQDAVLERWVTNGALDKVGPGKYRVTLDMSKMFEDTSFIRMEHSQELAKQIKSGRYDFKATLTFDFLTSDAGFALDSTERMVKISVEVKLAKNSGVIKKYEVRRLTESYVINPSTPKVFSLFTIFPEKKELHENYALDSQDNIYGKVYFNGDVTQTTVTNLPVFYDTLLLGGEFKYAVVPTEEVVAAYKDKFKRGLITNVSAERFILNPKNNGEGCISPSLPILNGTQLACDYTIKDYAEQNGPSCRVIAQNNGRLHYMQEPDDSEVCASNDPWITSRFITGGFSEVKVQYKCIFVMAAVENLIVGAGGETSSVYGIIAGGKIEKSGGHVNFYSLQNIHSGTACVATDATVESINSRVAAVRDTVLIPLVNLPSVYSVSTGVR